MVLKSKKNIHPSTFPSIILFLEHLSKNLRLCFDQVAKDVKSFHFQVDRGGSRRTAKEAMTELVITECSYLGAGFS